MTSFVITYSYELNVTNFCLYCVGLTDLDLHMYALMCMHIVHIHIRCNFYFRSGCKDKNSSSKSTSAKMASIQGSPTDLTYAKITKPDAHTEQRYARMSALKVRVK